MKKNLFIHIALYAILHVGFSLISSAQTTLYSENFSNGLLNNKGQNGVTYDMSGVTNWTINIASGTFAAGDWFKQTTTGYFESIDTDALEGSPVIWYSTVEDITCYTNVTVSADLGRLSSNSGSGCRAQYSLNGGAWQTFGEKVGSGGTEAFQTYTQAGLSGTSIQIRIIHWGTSSTPSYRHDNITIIGTFAPATPPSNILLTNYTGTSIDINWTNGSGNSVLVTAKESTSLLSDPIYGTSYTSNSIYGSGSEIGVGNYVVYNSNGTSVTITGLSPGLHYDFAIYTYNSAGPCYNTDELMGTTQCTPPTTQCSAPATSGITANSMLVSWTNGNGDATLVVAKPNSALRTDPLAGIFYSDSPVFGNGTEIGTDNFVVYNGTGNSVTVTGLTSSTTYDFAVYTYFSSDNCYHLSEVQTQGTTLLVSSPYILNAVNGMIIGTCSGNFYDSGGSGGNYTNNENYTVTFCSASGLPLKFDFSNSGDFNMESGSGDTLFFYEGMTATGTPIATLSQSDDISFSQLTINTSSTCVTIVFHSNSSIVDGGWNGVISCGEPPVCLSNEPAADIFRQATTICNIADYCGTTASYYGEDTPFNLIGGGDCPAPTDGIFGGTIENNSWLKFQALSTTATFDFTVSTGATCIAGIQVAIFSFNEVTKAFSLKSPCNYTDGGHLGSFTVSATGLTVGETYYVMIDGNAGDQCDYTLGVSTGVAIIDAGPDQAVCDPTATLHATATINQGTWVLISGTGIIDDPNDPQTTVSGLSMGSNIFQWETNSDLCGSSSDQVTITLSSCLPVTLLDLKATYNSENTIRVNWATASELNNDFFIIERSSDGLTFVPISIADGNGTTNYVIHYAITDTISEVKTYYYRLQQIDFDGTVTVSQTVVAEPPIHGSGTELIISTDPNTSGIQILFHADEDSEYTLQVYDITGRIVHTEQFMATAGANTIHSGDFDMAHGIACVSVRNDHQNLRGKFLR